jgi:signal transduction histidine kinase
VAAGYRRDMSTQWPASAPPPRSRPRPPLTQRLRPGFWVALDWVAAGLCALVLVFDLHNVVEPSDGTAALVLCVVAGVAVSAPIVVRRRAPLGALTATVLLALTYTLVVLLARHSLLAPPASASGVTTAELWQDAPGLLLPTAYVLHLVAARYRRKTAITALAVILGLIVIEGVLERVAQPSGQGAAVLIAFVVIVSWGTGYTVGQRRAYGAALRDQAASAAVTEERLRIARELHDVVAHSMTVIAVQAGYGKHVIDTRPDQAREALGAIQGTSREALSEMRRMLGVLRQSDPAPYGKTSESNRDGAAPSLATGVTAGRGDGDAAPLAPQPGLADLGRLIERIDHAGVKVDLVVRGERPELAPGIDLAAFRIVQEALTNVVKHSGAPRCSVTVSYAEDELTVEITDEGRGSPVPAGAAGGEGAELPGGHGLTGMRERVNVYGGLLAAGPRPECGFGVMARLPLAGGTR